MADTAPTPPTAVNVRFVPVIAALLFTALALIKSHGPDDPRDFFIFRLGAELALHGENPYDVPKVHQHIAVQFPNEDAKEFVNNSGYFLPPLAVLAFMPFAILPWGAAKIAWAILNGLAAYYIARLPLMLRAKDSPPTSVLLAAVVPFALLMNPLALMIPFPVGQFSVIFVGCVAAGLWCFDRGRPYLAAVLWTLPFVKPHLAIPLIPLAWFLGGWKPAALLVALVGVLNLAGATVVGGSPLFLREYLAYLPTAREAVAYNRVEMNPQITSWNRLLFACGGPLIELGAAGIVAGYLVWFGLIVGRCAATNTSPSAVWAAAATAVGGLLCAQVLVYELMFLLVAVPWVRELFANGYRLRGWLVIGLMMVQIVPQDKMEAIGLAMQRPLGVALLAVLVLVGPLRFGERGA